MAPPAGLAPQVAGAGNEHAAMIGGVQQEFF
jgi:hypothetical protein